MRTVLQEKLYTWITTILLALLYTVFIIGHALQSTELIALQLMPFLILTTLILGFASTFVDRNTKVFLWFAVTGAVFLLLQIIGVTTGAVFGSYTYGQTLGLQLIGVPPMASLNWALIILGSISLVEILHIRVRIFKIIMASMIIVLFDYVMEPIAVCLDFWQWEGTSVPLQNYAAMGIIAAAAVYLYEKMHIRNEQKQLFVHILFIQYVFFTALLFVV